MGCLFCNIINGETPSTKVYENDKVFAFEDIRPLAPVHVLIVPKVHVEKIEDMDVSSCSVMSDMFLAVKEIARMKGIDQMGYRLIVNNGKAGGQVIWHIHLHLLGGMENLGPMLAT